MTDQAIKDLLTSLFSDSDEEDVLILDQKADISLLVFGCCTYSYGSYHG